MDQFVKNPAEFWPKSGNTFNNNVWASIRFIVYSTLITYLIKRDPKIIVLGIFVLTGIYLYFKVNPQPSINSQDPMNNFTDERIYDEDEVTKFMEKAFPDDTRNAQRGFFTMPNMDLEPFLAMQGRGRSYCRDDQSACTAEGNTHFPDEATMRAQYPLSAQLSRF